MFTRLAWMMAVGGGVWGIGLSILLLTSLRFDALFFLLLLLLIHAVVISVAFWREAKPLWRGTVWTVAGSLLLYLAYLSRFSVGIYLLPAAGLILLAGVLVIARGPIPAIWEELDKVSSPEPPETTQTQERQIDPRLRKLTPRELEVLLLIAEGKSNQEIADALVISPNTVRHHVHQILRKLNCSSRGEAAVVAKLSGLHSPDRTDVS